jgi:hypothetical protein
MAFLKKLSYVAGGLGTLSIVSGLVLLACSPSPLNGLEKREDRQFSLEQINERNARYCWKNKPSLSGYLILSGFYGIGLALIAQQFQMICPERERKYNNI